MTKSRNSGIILRYFYNYFVMESVDKGPESREVVDNLTFEELGMAVERANRVVKFVDGAYRTASGHVVVNIINQSPAGTGRWYLVDAGNQMLSGDSYERQEEGIEAGRKLIETDPAYDLVD